jgi:hypothetical protein
MLSYYLPRLYHQYKIAHLCQLGPLMLPSSFYKRSAMHFVGLKARNDGEGCHYGRSPIFPFNDNDQPGLRHNCFDRGIIYDLKKYICRHQDVVSYDFCEVISFGIFVSFNILPRESFEIIFQPSN